MTQYTLRFADSTVESTFALYYNELVATITQLEAVIDIAKKSDIAAWYIESAEGTVTYANEAIERRLTHMTNMTAYSDGIVSREVALSAAGTLAGTIDNCIAAIDKLKESMEDAQKRAKQKAEREAGYAQDRANNERREREYQENRQRNNRQDSGWRDNARQGARFPAGVTQWAIDEIKNKGYRAAAVANHPDRGGDNEKMVQINATNDYLKKMGLV